MTYWQGKKLVWNGDSISYGSQLKDIRTAFPLLVAERLGMTVANYAIGGAICRPCRRLRYTLRKCVCRKNVRRSTKNGVQPLDFLKECVIIFNCAKDYAQIRISEPGFIVCP